MVVYTTAMFLSDLYLECCLHKIAPCFTIVKALCLCESVEILNPLDDVSVNKLGEHEWIVKGRQKPSGLFRRSYPVGNYLVCRW